MIRFIEEERTAENGDSGGRCLTLDKKIWQKGREYFFKYKSAEVFPVFKGGGGIIGYAWQDREANREIRMIRELRECKCAINFCDLNPAITKVVIHGCNELAWYMREYLIEIGMEVYVDGKFWEELGVQTNKVDYPDTNDYEIWAEGVHQRGGDWKKERLRSASVEFECIDKIYEANIMAGKINDACVDFNGLVKMLHGQKNIVIRGTGTKAQDAYDWLLANNIDICAFQSGKINGKRKSLFNRPILTKAEVEKNYKEAVVIECASKHSAWGFGEVDKYDYEGYERNKRYFILRDYIEVSENNLVHILRGKTLILTGDLRLCKHVYRWYREKDAARQIVYWNIMHENSQQTQEVEFSVVNEIEAGQNDILMLVAPQYAVEGVVTKEIAQQYNIYTDSFKAHGIIDYTDYFCDMVKLIHLETETIKYPSKKLRPAGIVLGAIPPFSGNVLVRFSLADHSQIVMMDESGKGGVFLDIGLYCICMRLAEEKAENILSVFWDIYQNEAAPGTVERDFVDIEKFNKKMKDLLSISESFTSQELFVIFHIAFAEMCGYEITDLENTIIYWEPHYWDRNIVREWACWLGSPEVKGYTINMARNRYIRAGSAIRTINKLHWEAIIGCIYRNNVNYIKKKTFDNWSERTIKFEDLKCYPQKVLTELCEWWGISFDKVLMETTYHGEKVYYDTITGFDVKPAYNLYEEFFSVFDRMRISMLAGSYQEQYQYPYISCLNFTRRELQEMFLKDFRWERLPGAVDGKQERYFYVQNTIRYLLWLERFAAIMGVNLDEEY